MTLGLQGEIVDRETRNRAVAHFRQAGVTLPTFAQLVDPSLIDQDLDAVGPDDAEAANLFRVHWYNGPDRCSRVALPAHLVLPSSLTGVASPIVVLLGSRFPMIGAHKVLATYGCLAPRVVTGQFDPSRHRAVWPSTGNYCRGGIAVSRIMGCRGVAVLPEGMSRERFAWLERWTQNPADIVRTPGTESNVKEIYDKCAELRQDTDNVIINQFCEFGNYLAHYACTGRALEHVFSAIKAQQPESRLRALVLATGSAGTLGAGDYLKERLGSATVAVEALECPTLLYNGFGEHNIQGIGDKHVPLIHNVMATDFVTGVSERSSDALLLLFGSDVGRRYLAERRGVDPAVVECLHELGLSSLANIIAAIKLAKHVDAGDNDVIMTVATDAAQMYVSEQARLLPRYAPEGIDDVIAAELYAEHVLGARTDHLLELNTGDRQRIFNLGYYTWVEQQGTSLEEFEGRRNPAFWRGLQELLPQWDALIEDFNRAVAGAG